MGIEVVCNWCDRPLRFDSVKGWVHEENGEIYWRLPNGEDDHCALPVRRKKT